MDLGLKDVHVLITGASGGIGLETLRVFLEQGARVTAHYNNNFTPFFTLEGFDSQFRICPSNLCDEGDTKKLFDYAQEESNGWGPVQVVVVNHAIYESTFTPIWDMSLDQWNNTIQTNLTSTFLVARQYLRRLSAASAEAKAKASMILIGSTAGKYGEAGHTDYAASKSAMMYGLTMSLKNEIVKIAPAGRVNTVAPGWTRTPIAEESLKNPEIVYAALASTPLKKVAMPSDIATQIAVLSSNKISGHVTGQVLMVEGGMEGRVLNSPADLGLGPGATL